MHSKEIAQSTVKRNAIYIVRAGSDLIETVGGCSYSPFNVFNLSQQKVTATSLAMFLCKPTKISACVVYNCIPLQPLDMVLLLLKLNCFSTKILIKKKFLSEKLIAKTNMKSTLLKVIF